MQSREAIDKRYLEELRIQHSAELLGIVIRATEEVDTGSCYNRVCAQVEDQRRFLLESVKVRLDAREGEVSYEGGKAALLEEVKKHHVRAMHEVESMIESLRTPNSYSQVKAAALELLRDRQKELEEIFSAKYELMETMELHSNALADLCGEEEAIADGFVKLARANPENVILQHVAVRAMVRSMEIATHAGASSGVRAKEEWTALASNLRETESSTPIPHHIHTGIVYILRDPAVPSFNVSSAAAESQGP